MMTVILSTLGALATGFVGAAIIGTTPHMLRVAGRRIYRTLSATPLAPTAPPPRMIVPMFGPRYRPARIRRRA